MDRFNFPIFSAFQKYGASILTPGSLILTHNAEDEQWRQAWELVWSGTPFIVTGPPLVGTDKFVMELLYQLRQEENHYQPFRVHSLTVPAREPLNRLNESIAFLRQNAPSEGVVVVLEAAEFLSNEIVLDVIQRYKSCEFVITVIVTSLRSFNLPGVKEIKLGYRWFHNLYFLEGEAVAGPSNQIVNVVSPRIITASDFLIEKLKRQPTDLFKINPRQFEELIADLLTGMEMEVHLTPQTRDGGKDILAYMQTELGRILCLVETKQYNQQRPVGIGLVRTLYGTVKDYGATNGMLVTTSRFSRDAKSFQERHKYELTLKEYGDVVDWLLEHRSK